MKLKFLFLFVILAPGLNAQNEFLEAFTTKWQNSAKFTLECAEMMPENLYDYAPTPEEMSFKKQLIHMIQNMLWLSTDNLDLEPFHSELRNADPNKSELIQLIAKGFDHIGTQLKDMPAHKLREKVDFFAGEMTIYQIIELMDDHLTHHRGQLCVYLRLNNLKPPSYVGW